MQGRGAALGLLLTLVMGPLAMAVGAQQIPESHETRVPHPNGVVVARYEHEVLYDPEESIVFNRPAFLVAANGLIYVTDFGDKKVVVLDEAGRHQFSFAGPGQGPGELEDAWNIAATADGNVYVYDRSQRIHAFTAEGEFLQALEVPGLGFLDPKSMFALDEDTLVVSGPSHAEGAYGYGVHLLDVVRDGARMQLVLRRSFADTERLDAYLHPFVAGGTATLDLDGEILYTQNSPYSLRKYSRDGELRWRIDDEQRIRPWRELMKPGPDGRVQPRLYPYSHGLWPLREGVYLNLLLSPTPEFAEYEESQQRGGFEGKVLEETQEIVWVIGGELTRRVSFRPEHEMEFFARDAKGRLYGRWNDRIVRTSIEVRWEE